MNQSLSELLKEIRSCTICADSLALGPRPVLRVNESAKILIVGQAPGLKVHESGIPWNDKSGERLRQWMDVDNHTFYDESQIAIIPMGFCYPGKGPSGDLPPRQECAAHYHERLLKLLPSVELTLLFGKYALNYFLPNTKKKTLTEAVANWKSYAPDIIPMAHPSPRNIRWFKENQWFLEELIPYMRERIHSILNK